MIAEISASAGQHGTAMKFRGQWASSLRGVDNRQRLVRRSNGLISLSMVGQPESGVRAISSSAATPIVVREPWRMLIGEQ